MKNILASKDCLNYDSMKWCVINTKTSEMIEPQRVKINKNLFIIEDESKEFSRAVPKNDCQVYEEDGIFYYNDGQNNFIIVHKGE